MMCQHFSGHRFKQLVAAIHSLQATNSHWRNEVARGCKTLRYIRTPPVLPQIGFDRSDGV